MLFSCGQNLFVEVTRATSDTQKRGTIRGELRNHMVREPSENKLALVAGGLVGVKASRIALSLQWSDITEERQLLPNILDIHIDFIFVPQFRFAFVSIRAVVSFRSVRTAPYFGIAVGNSLLLRDRPLHA